MPKPYRSAITTHVGGRPYVYGYDLAELAGTNSFARAIYLILKGEMPDKNSEKMLEAILTISIDHGVEPPSVVAARNVYSGGSPVQAAVASGILALGEYHGGAIEAAMENFLRYCPPAGGGGGKLGEEFAEAVEGKLLFGGKRLPINIDGIIAALLLEMGFNPKVGKGVFIIARTPGLVAHVVEEALREKPFRRLSEKDVEYDGPRPRK